MKTEVLSGRIMRATRIVAVLTVLSVCGMLAACCTAPTAPSPCTPPAQAVSVDLNFNTLLDLDTGATAPVSGTPSGGGWDLSLANNGTRPIHATVFQYQLSSGVQIAHLRGRGFDTVSFADVAGASFGSTLIDEPFDTARVILIRTDTGAVYKLGSDNESAGGASFRYARLSAGDCPCTLPAPAATMNLGFNMLLNLATGATTPVAGAPSGGAWDLSLAYNGTRPVHAVVFQYQLASGVQIAHLRGRNFATVTFADVAGAAFGTTLIDEPFDTTRVVLIRTHTGEVYKLGSVAETPGGGTFRYARLSAGNCP